MGSIIEPLGRNGLHVMVILIEYIEPRMVILELISIKQFLFAYYFIVSHILLDSG